ncbi:hypothetical protein ACC848_43615, partial [Rhizobium johnstonii]
RGIDVGAKSEIYEILYELAAGGMADRKADRMAQPRPRQALDLQPYAAERTFAPSPDIADLASDHFRDDLLKRGFGDVRMV